LGDCEFPMPSNTAGTARTRRELFADVGMWPRECHLGKKI